MINNENKVSLNKEIGDENKLAELSIFLLAYNEEGNIKKSINTAFEAGEKNTNKFEVIVVLYAGSGDNTKNIVNSMISEKPNLRLVIQPFDKKGYGAAIKIGIENSKYKHIFYTDADNQFDTNEISRLIPYTNKYDIVSGYRHKRQDQLMRILAAKTYNLLLDTMFFVYFKDVDSAFKIYNKKIFDKVKITCNTGMADAEILIRSKKAGFKIKEVPVTHYARQNGEAVFDSNKLGIIKPAVVSNLLKDMFKLRFSRFK
jgi:glycosyltransferase involved in cell wall biosynthesis